jgi:hypothetical protein
MLIVWEIGLRGAEVRGMGREIIEMGEELYKKMDRNNLRYHTINIYL